MNGRAVTRGKVANDWGLQLRWVVPLDRQVIATPPARATETDEHPDATPGTSEIAREMVPYASAEAQGWSAKRYRR